MNKLLENSIMTHSVVPLINFKVNGQKKCCRFATTRLTRSSSSERLTYVQRGLCCIFSLNFHLLSLALSKLALIHARGDKNF